MEKLKQSGKLEILAKTLSIEINKIEKVSFFGIEEIPGDDDEDESDGGAEPLKMLGDSDPSPEPSPQPPAYLMEIYKVSGILGYFIGYVGKPNGKNFLKCGNSNRLFELPLFN